MPLTSGVYRVRGIPGRARPRRTLLSSGGTPRPAPSSLMRSGGVASPVPVGNGPAPRAGCAHSLGPGT
eukprot:scaffold2145_cov309-Prasinococcus_capsulatus_cf.AAC.3